MFRATSYAQVAETLKKPCGERSDDDVDYIIPWIQGLSKPINVIPKDVLRTLLKEGIFLTVPKGTPITIQGEQGHCYFIVLRGRVSASGNTSYKHEKIQFPPEIQLTSLDEKISQGIYETDPLPTTLNRSVFGNIFNELVSFALGNFRDVYVQRYTGNIPDGIFLVAGFPSCWEVDAADRFINEQEDGIEASIFFIQVSGKSFGDMALMSEDNMRRTSTIAEDVSDLLVIEKELYCRCLLKQHISELILKGELFNLFPAVNEWNDREITNLALSLRLYKVKTGSNIVTQGEPFDGLHFIVKGQARISVELGLHAHQFEKIFRLEPVEEKTANEKKRLFQPRNKCQFAKAASYAESEQKNILERAVKSISKHCPLSLSIVDPVAITGDIEFLLGWNVWYSTVTCTEDCQILQLDVADCANIFRTRRKLDFFIKLARDKVTLMLQRWPEPSPVGLLNIASRELDKLSVAMPDMAIDNTMRRKRFSLFSITTGRSHFKRRESMEDWNDGSSMLKDQFLKLRRLTQQKLET